MSNRKGAHWMERSKRPLKHWGLDRWPFAAGLAALAQFYPTAAGNEALARIEHLAEARRRLAVLVGPSGCGKSLLLAVAERQLGRAGRAVVCVDAFGLSPREFLWQIAAGLGSAPAVDADVPRTWRQIADRVVENRLQQTGSVLLVDNAGQAGPDIVTQIIRLARLDSSSSACWTIVLAATPAEAARWPATLRELVDLRIDLPPWEPGDTIGFVQTALMEAGSVGPVFEPDALSAIHEKSGGVPRQAARLAEMALLAGAAAGGDRIEAALVRAVAEESAWPATAC
jgi:type II secretory pathway predicted ATPase ExeA